MEPSVGTKSSAINSDASSTAISVMGRNFMNSPITPGQNASGMNAASVVQVDAMIGHAIRRAALEYASWRSMPSAMRRSANSVTTIAPSTSRPTAMINANSTIMLMLMPKDAMVSIASRKLPGIATPTRMPARTPSIPIIMMKTSRTAEITLFCKSESIRCTSFDLSRDATMVIPSGQ